MQWYYVAKRVFLHNSTVSIWIHTHTDHTWEVECGAHAHTVQIQIISIMPHDSTRGLSSTIPVELVLEFDPVFRSFLITLYQTRSQTPSQCYDLQCEELNSPCPLVSSRSCRWKAALERSDWRQRLQRFSRRKPCNFRDDWDVWGVQKFFHCGLSWTLSCVMTTSGLKSLEKVTRLASFDMRKRVAKSWPQLAPAGH